MISTFKNYRLIHIHYYACSRISLYLIAITSSMSFVGTFLRSRSRHLPRSRDRSRTRDSGTTWKGRRSGEQRSARRGEEREGGCPNGIRIGMGREPCTKQPRRHPAFARIATLASWLAHGKHTVSRERKQILRNRAAHCLDPPPRGRLRLQHRRL